MKCLLVLSVLVAVTATSSLHRVRRGNGDQQPKVWDAIVKLRGKDLIPVDQIQELYFNVIPGQDFPLISEIPKTNIDCASFKQPGFYADDSNQGRCQVFHRCDVNGELTSYLCPNMTLFNQITLICDVWYNVDCSQSKQFQDYSNSRLYRGGAVLLDDQMEVAIKEATGAVQSTQKPSNKNSRRSQKVGRSQQSEESSE